MHLHMLVIMHLYILLACRELCGIKRWSSIAVTNYQAVAMLIKQPSWQQKQRLPSLCSCCFSACHKISGDNTGRMETKGAKARQPSNIPVDPLVLFCKPPGSPPPTVTVLSPSNLSTK